MKAVISIVITLGLFWVFTDKLPFSNEITEYQMFCPGGRKDNRCDSREETANPTTYKIFLNQQTIIYWTGSSDVPHRLWHCAIRDVENWSCQLGYKLEENPKYQWQMVNGKFQEINDPPETLPNIFYQVPKWRWWLTWVLERVQ